MKVKEKLKWFTINLLNKALYHLQGDEELDDFASHN